MSHYVETASAKAASAATFGGSALGIFGGLNGWLNSLNWNAVATVGGLFLGVAGFALNAHFQRKRDQREHREHMARMKELNAAR